MRSSKKRSRSNQNRPRSLGNIVNRVFDSSGPEGKVRGTPQQIIEKYQMLARDAQLSNDRVSAENFLQHAEHYTRMLAEAMREMAAEQEARQQQAQSNGGQHGGQNGGHGFRADRQGDGRDRGDRCERRQDFAREFRDDRDSGGADQPRVVDVIDLGSDEGSSLIETPESAPRPRAEPAEPVAEARAESAVAETREERSQNRRPRGPRKPKSEGKSESKSDGEPPKEAAE
ncbi:DUF4167 domain-containing protein [Tabrizicola caldifontis]|uniref:DUF4167 domain-containing protein n=1 Tax=Tabrizicola caldifontis TaxID=2528036 RepID=UPI00108162D2|nr:DUF4167 domain-containing protein [Rhodobacter sp. YIM 73028]